MDRRGELKVRRKGRGRNEMDRKEKKRKGKEVGRSWRGLYR